MSNQKPLAVVLLSGGLDSTTTLAIAIAEGFVPCCLTFDYGQRHRLELEAAASVAQRYGIGRHVVFPLDLGAFGGSALTSEIPVPKGRSAEACSQSIPVTYVPARNTVFLSVALAWAETLGAKAIFIGVNAIDYSGYPDCRPEFIAAFESLANLATKAGVEDGQPIKIHTPLLHLSKADIVRKGIELGVDYSLTSTCYDPTEAGEACGQCDACTLRLTGFHANGLKDPIRYRAGTGTAA